jgi:aspartate kinase
LEELGEPNTLLSALDFMRTVDGQPDEDYLVDNLVELLDKDLHQDFYITQGYICRNEQGEIDNLRRGGSDYSASLIGAAIGADEIQIWTDIDGMHNNDPRIVKNTKPVHELSFDEAAELAYFGAKILHPQSILPAQKHGVPVRLKYTMKPEAPGTAINKASVDVRIKSIAAKDDITAIRIKSGRMLMAHGFLSKIFQVFDSYKTAVDVITTSEVAVSLTIDNTLNLDKILTKLEKIGKVDVEHDQTIICVVGQFIQQDSSLVSHVFSAVGSIPIRMISFGGSRSNITFIVNKKHKEEVLIRLHERLFDIENLGVY